jgi:transcriptional regulator with XRE-family HTH domain
MPDEFGAELKRLREARGMTQEGTATACGLPITTRRTWEQGRRRPDLVSAYLLARALGVTVDELAKLAADNPLTDRDGRRVATPTKRKGTSLPKAR